MTTPGARPHDLPALPIERDGPVFEEPWQATAFALAVHLSERGAIRWSEWSAALGQEIEAAAGGRGRVEGYFENWLRALERICAEKGMVDPTEIRRRQDQWRRAHLATPHGEPVELTATRGSTCR